MSNLQYIYKAVRLSVRHADYSPGTVHINTSRAQHKALIIRLLQVCYCKFTHASIRSLQRVEGQGVKKT